MEKEKYTACIYINIGSVRLFCAGIGVNCTKEMNELGFNGFFQI